MGRELFTTASADIPVRSVAFNPTGDLVALTRLVGEHAVTMWDVASKTETRRQTGRPAPVNAVAFSHDRSLLAAGHDDNTLKVWKLVALLTPPCHKVGRRRRPLGEIERKARIHQPRRDDPPAFQH